MSATGGVFWWWSGENRSPKVTANFLERQRRILLPGQYAREHRNEWVDAADALTSAADVDAAMGHGWTEQVQGKPHAEYAMFVDLGAVHDPSVIALGHAEGDLTYIDRLLTFQGSREEPVQLAEVDHAIRDLARRFPLVKIRVESWQGLAVVQTLHRLGLPVELFTPTAKVHAEEWPVLAQRLAGRMLVLPLHARLREELLNLVYEVGPQGVRVLDRGAIHQDHAVAVRGVVAMLAARAVALPPLTINGQIFIPDPTTGELVAEPEPQREPEARYDGVAPYIPPPGVPLIRLHFLAAYGVYARNECAGFDEDLADQLCADGIAVRADAPVSPDVEAHARARREAAQRERAPTLERVTDEYVQDCLRRTGCYFPGD